jgi:hypothetical protein
MVSPLLFSPQIEPITFIQEKKARLSRVQVYRPETRKSLDEIRNTWHRRKKMSQEIDLLKDSGGDDGEWPNTASAPPLSLSRKRPRHEDVGSGDAQVLVDHRESHEGIAAAVSVSHPMTLDSELTSRNDESADKYSQKQSTSKAPSNASRRQSRVSYREDRLSELADYRKIHGHCNVPRNYSENTKLAKWVAQQRVYYRLHKKGKTSPMTTFRIQELESLGFEWASHASAWEDRLSELADYRKIHGHCNVPQNYSENAKLANWVGTQRENYRLRKEGKTLSMTLSRIQELESLGFEWGVCITAWQDRLSKLADYRKIHGHCNVPRNYSENNQLGRWVSQQRGYYRLHKEGKKSSMTTFRIQELESLGFEWGVCVTAWEDRLSELADYRKINGHCNVPKKYSENAKLGSWVGTQRVNYRLRKEGKTSPMTTFRIQELECLGFEWGKHASAWEDRLSELADYRKIHGHCNVPQNYSENAKLAKWVGTQKTNYRLHKEGKTSPMTTFRIQELESLGFEWGRHASAWEDRLNELADYRKSHGHCNVPQNYSENAKLAKWVETQKTNYRLRKEGKTSPMTLSRIQELESLGFEWKACAGRPTRNPKKASLDDGMTRVCERAVEAPEHVQTMAQAQEDLSGREICRVAIMSTSPLSPKNPTGMAKSNFAYIPGRTEEI